MTIIPVEISAFGTVTKGFLMELEDLEVGGRVETIQTTTIENGQNTGKSPGDSRIAVPRIPEKDHQLMSV